MTYPDDFVADCIRLYPDWTELHRALTNGKNIVGRYLSDAAVASLPLHVILSATSLDVLQQQARLQRERCDLYTRWIALASA